MIAVCFHVFVLSIKYFKLVTNISHSKWTCNGVMKYTYYVTQKKVLSDFFLIECIPNIFFSFYHLHGIHFNSFMCNIFPVVILLSKLSYGWYPMTKLLSTTKWKGIFYQSEYENNRLTSTVFVSIYVESILMLRIPIETSLNLLCCKTHYNTVQRKILCFPK